jgi:predicted CopG family antitoxin
MKVIKVSEEVYKILIHYKVKWHKKTLSQVIIELSDFFGEY